MAYSKTRAHCYQEERKQADVLAFSRGIALALSKLGVFKLLGKGEKFLICLAKEAKTECQQEPGRCRFDTSTMYVSAQVVNLYGNTIQTPGGGGTPTGGHPTGDPLLLGQHYHQEERHQHHRAEEQVA